VVDTKNQLDGMIFSSEKMVKDAGDKISAEAKKEVEDACTEAKKHLNSESLEELKSAIEKLESVTHKIASDMYSKAGGNPEEAKAGEEPSKKDKKSDDDDVVDADFKEV
jgi:molecular chaperone DnaK